MAMGESPGSLGSMVAFWYRMAANFIVGWSEAQEREARKRSQQEGGRGGGGGGAHVIAECRASARPHESPMPRLETVTARTDPAGSSTSAAAAISTS